MNGNGDAKGYGRGYGNGLRNIALLILIVLLSSTKLLAQNTISGKVLDPQSKPVANIEVLLHAVEEKAGNQVDRDTTRPDGSFTLTAKTLDPKAVYFVAVVWKKDLYIGELLRPPFPKTQDYVVQVGVNPVDLGNSQNAAPAVTPQEEKSSHKAGLIVVAVAVLVIALVVAFALQRRPPSRRRWLLELARIEDELERTPGDNAALQRRRAELRARLRAAPAG